MCRCPGKLCGCSGHRDTDGYVNGRFIGNDTFSFCYTQAGSKTESSVVNCTQVKTRALTHVARDATVVG
jgi:hypothetical protein